MNLKNQIFITMLFTFGLADSMLAMQPSDLSMQLAAAAYEGKTEEVKRLLAEGANPNAPAYISAPKQAAYYDALSIRVLLKLI